MPWRARNRLHTTLYRLQLWYLTMPPYPLIDVKQQQRGFKANGVRYPGINFADIAEGENWRSYRVNNPRELQMSLKKAMTGTTPALIDVTVDAAGYRAQLEAVRDAPFWQPTTQRKSIGI